MSSVLSSTKSVMNHTGDYFYLSMISKSCSYIRNFRYSPTTVYFTDDGNLVICSDIPILVDADSLIKMYCLISIHRWISLFCLISFVLPAFMFIFSMKQWYSIVLFLYLSLWLCNLFSKQALRFFQMVWWSLWLQAVLYPTHLFKMKTDLLFQPTLP